MAADLILTFNPGSSSIKIGVFEIHGTHANRIGKAEIDLRHTPLRLRVSGAETADIELKAVPSEDQHEVLDETLGWLGQHFPLDRLKVIGHRVVHGGDLYSDATRINADVHAKIKQLIPLAPLHQPHSERLIRAFERIRPDLPQVASFDTAFHRGQDEVVRRFALPRDFYDRGIKRYGFHGLSYKFIARRLAAERPDLANGRVIVAHLGSGASLCAMTEGQSRDSSMGFSTLEGVPMATRCGTLDPGVIVYLMVHEGLSLRDVQDIIYYKSGLLGMSGISADSRDLLASDRPEAAQALDIFAHRVAGEACRLAGTIGGLDTFVFTAGIGEHQPPIRARICERLTWLGVELDPKANAADAPVISSRASRVNVLVMPTDEETIIAEEAIAHMASTEIVA